MVRQVRDWIKVTAKSDPPAWKKLWLRYSEFYSHFAKTMNQYGYAEDEILAIEVAEFIEFAETWIKSKRLPN